MLSVVSGKHDVTVKMATMWFKELLTIVSVNPQVKFNRAEM